MGAVAQAFLRARKHYFTTGGVPFAIWYLHSYFYGDVRDSSLVTDAMLIF
jgi:hypothetical protein